MCAPSPPPPVDYAAAARTQGAANLQTGIAQSVLNRPDEFGPLGSRIWSENGSFTVPAAEGNDAVTIPKFTSNTTLSPVGQQLQDSSGRIALNLAGAGEKALSGVNASLSAPLDLSSLPQGRDAITDAMYNRSKRMLDPQYADLDRQNENMLINKGFSTGTEGYDKARDRFTAQRDTAYADARDRAMTTGSATANAERQQSINEILLKRQQPLAELSSLRTGAAPQMPQFQAYGGAGNVAASPMFQAAQAQGGQANDIYGQQVAQSNSTLGGLASLGGAAMMATSMF